MLEQMFHVFLTDVLHPRPAILFRMGHFLKRFCEVVGDLASWFPRPSEVGPSSVHDRSGHEAHASSNAIPDRHPGRHDIRDLQFPSPVMREHRPRLEASQEQQCQPAKQKCHL